MMTLIFSSVVAPGKTRVQPRTCQEQSYIPRQDILQANPISTEVRVDAVGLMDCHGA